MAFVVGLGVGMFGKLDVLDGAWEECSLFTRTGCASLRWGLQKCGVRFGWRQISETSSKKVPVSVQGIYAIFSWLSEAHYGVVSACKPLQFCLIPPVMSRLSRTITGLHCVSLCLSYQERPKTRIDKLILKDPPHLLQDKFLNLSYILEHLLPTLLLSNLALYFDLL